MFIYMDDALTHILNDAYNDAMTMSEQATTTTTRITEAAAAPVTVSMIGVVVGGGESPGAPEPEIEDVSTDDDGSNNTPVVVDIETDGASADEKVDCSDRSRDFVASVDCTKVNWLAELFF